VVVGHWVSRRTGCEPELVKAYFEGGPAVDALRAKVDRRLGAGRYDRWKEPSHLGRGRGQSATRTLGILGN